MRRNVRLRHPRRIRPASRHLRGNMEKIPIPSPPFARSRASRASAKHFHVGDTHPNHSHAENLDGPRSPCIVSHFFGFQMRLSYPFSLVRRLLASVLACAAGLLVSGCGRPSSSSSATSTGVRTVAQATSQTSETCMQCHTAQHALWAGTDHALANRPVASAAVEAAFTAQKSIADGGSAFDLAWNHGRPSMTPPATASAPAATLSPDLILGHLPIWQPLIPAGGGRWQPTDLAYDPVKKDWFNVFAQENRRQGEWGTGPDAA